LQPEAGRMRKWKRCGKYGVCGNGVARDERSQFRKKRWLAEALWIDDLPHAQINRYNSLSRIDEIVCAGVSNP